MYVVISIAGDPTSWWTESYPNAAALVAQLDGGSVAVPVVAPLQGTLLLSADEAGGVTIIDQSPDVSWIPSGITAPTATLYLPSSTGPAADSPGYTLPAGTNLDDLQNQIIAAMDEGRTVTVPVTSAVGTGTAVLIGTSLRFAVVCPPSA